MDIIDMAKTELAKPAPQPSRLRNCVTLLGPMFTVAKAVLFADSENSRKSMWVAYELQYAEKTHKPIYTVGFDGMKEINELKDYWFRNIRVEKVPL